MTIASAASCVYPSSLEQSTADFLQEIGDYTSAIMSQIPAVQQEMESMIPFINAGNNILQNLLGLGDPAATLKTLDDIAKLFGIDPVKPNSVDDEKLLFLAGVIMIKGVIYVPGVAGEASGDNIEVLRRLYLASGRNLSKVEEYLALARDLQFTDKIYVQNVPNVRTNTAYAEDDVKRFLVAPYLKNDEIAYLPDASAIAILTAFLAENASIAHVQATTGLTATDITSSIFHYLAVKNDTSSINKWINYGYTTDQVTTILEGTDFKYMEPNPIDSVIVTNKQTASKIITDIDYVKSRLDTLDGATKASLQQKLVSSITALMAQHNNALALADFKVSTIKETDTLAKLRQRHTDDEIIYLLEVRNEVMGINFEATTAQIAAILTKLSSITSGSTTLSNVFINKTSDTRISERTLLLMYADLIQSQKFLQTGLTGEYLTTAKQLLLDYIGRYPVLEAGTTEQISVATGNQVLIPENSIPFQGMPSIATPGGLAFVNTNFDKSFQISLKIQAIEDLLAGLNQFFDEAIAQPLAFIINEIIKVILAAQAAINSLMDSILATIMPIKREYDAFHSKFLSLIGGGVFDSSLLKCAINFDISLSTPLLDALLQLIESLRNRALNAIAALGQLISNMIDTIFCKPLALLDDFLQPFNSVTNKGLSLLPPFCRIAFPIILPPDLLASLNELRAIVQLRGNLGIYFQSELIRGVASISTASERLQQFKLSTACRRSNASAGFMQSVNTNLNSALNAGVNGVMANPLPNGLPSLVSPQIKQAAQFGYSVFQQSGFA